MQVKPQFTFEKVRHDQAHNHHLVLSLTAPKSDWEKKRPPLCIIPVLDISGSMGGPKLEYAKQSILKLIDHLSADDYLGIVSFSSNARIESEPRKMTLDAKNELKALVNRFRTEGSTNFSTGMLMGLQIANKLDLPEATLVRVIMFTDGQPTHGITDPQGLSDLLDKQAGRATVSAFGYGTDANQELLQGLSERGKGNYAFVRDPDAALSAFGKELGGLLSTYAQDIRVDLTPNNGHQITEVLTDADVDEGVTGEVEIKVPHLLSEETAHIVVAVKLAEQKQAGPRQVNAFDVKVRYQVVDADGKLLEKVEEAKAKIQFVKPGEEQGKPTKEVDEIVARAQLTRAQTTAEAAASRGDFQMADAAFESLNFSERGHVGVAAVAAHVNGMYRSKGDYAKSGGNRMALRSAMLRGVGASHLDNEDREVLLQANYSVSNDAQDQMVEAFTGGLNQAPSVTSNTTNAEDLQSFLKNAAGLSGPAPLQNAEPKPLSEPPKKLDAGVRRLQKTRRSSW